MKFYLFIKNAIYSFLSKRTLGVRILLIHENKILLVKHTYSAGWYTIGGGVEPGESPLEAIKRELKEETGVTLKAPPQLFSVYYSNFEKRDDYIILYVGNEYTQEDNWSPEIKEKRWFSLDNLPEDISPATKKRIEEYCNKLPISDKW